MCSYYPDEKRVEFLGQSDIIKSFPIEYKGKAVTFSLRISNNFHYSIKGSAETESALILEFDETDDFKFFYELYYLILHFFSFVCNRQNIALDSATLLGKSTYMDRSWPDGREMG